MQNLILRPNLENKFLCALKVVDCSLYGIDPKDFKSKKSLQYATIVVIGERIEDMPVIRKIGDIIRIQKATQKEGSDGQIQFLVDERSNW